MADDLVGRQAGDPPGRGVPEPHDLVAVDEHHAVGDVLDDERCASAFLRRAVEARVVDCDRGAPREVLRKVEILLVVQPGRVRGDEHQGAEGSAACAEGNDHSRLHSELPEHLRVLLVLRRRREQLVGRDPIERRLAGADDAPRAFGLVGCSAVELL